MSSRISRRYRRVLAWLVVAMALAFGIAQALLAFRAAEREATRLQESELRAIANTIDQQLASLAESVVQVCRIPWSSGALGAEDQRGELRRLLRRHPEVVEAAIADAAGREAAFVSRVALDRVRSGRGVPRAEGEGGAVRVGDVFFSDGLAPHVRLTCTEDVAAGGFTTVAQVNLEFISEAVGAAGSRLAGDAFVRDARGRIIAHSRPAMVHSGGEVPSTMKGSTWTGPWRSPQLVSGTSLQHAPWRLGVAQRAGAVLAPAAWLVAATLALALLFLGVALFISRRLGAHLARPVQQLRSGVAAVAAGDLGRRVEVASGDELEDVATEFNRMAGELQAYTTGLERMVAERTAELEDAMRARALFLAAASHDLRQPLYAISLLADTLALEPLEAGGAEVLARQREAIAVLRALFDNLLDLSRFDAKEVRPVRRAVSLRELLAPAVLDAEVTCHAKSLAFHSRVDDVRVETDPDLLRRVVANLLSNAVRYTQAGGVQLLTRCEGESVEVTISDTGVGIPHDQHERVFEEFVQLGNPARARDRGVGLGLSIVRRIGEILGMPLQMTSTPGRGTVFGFRIPLAASAAPAASTGAEEIPPQGAFAGLHVWIVEDDLLVRGAMEMQLAAWGATFSFASTLAEARALREAQGWPSGVLLDDMLPEESGLEIAQWLRTGMAAERIVLSTGNVEASRLAALEDAGFTVLRKPLSSADLARCLRRIMAAAGVRPSPDPALAG